MKPITKVIFLFTFFVFPMILYADAFTIAHGGFKVKRHDYGFSINIGFGYSFIDNLSMSLQGHGSLLPIFGQHIRDELPDFVKGYKTGGYQRFPHYEAGFDVRVRFDNYEYRHDSPYRPYLIIGAGGRSIRQGLMNVLYQDDSGQWITFSTPVFWSKMHAVFSFGIGFEKSVSKSGEIFFEFEFGEEIGENYVEHREISLQTGIRLIISKDR